MPLCQKGGVRKSVRLGLQRFVLLHHEIFSQEQSGDCTGSFRMEKCAGESAITS